MRRLVALLIPLALALPALAHADDESASTELFNAGRDLMKRGDYAAACPKLAESVRLKPTVGALAKLAGCEEHEQHLAVAHARWMQALNLARSIGDPRVPDVEQQLARIDAVVPKLRFVGDALPDDVVIHVDGITLGAASVGVAIAVDPGHHAIVVEAAKKQPWRSAVDAKPDGATTTITVPALANEASPALAPAPAPALAPPPAPAPAPSPSPSRTLPIALTAAGVVGLGVGSYFGINALNKRNEAGCNGTVCPNDASAATLDDAKHAATLATIAFTAGGALVGAGALFYFLAPGSPVRASASASPHSASLSVAGTF